MITSPIPPSIIKPTPMDQAVQLYQGMGESFVELLDHYISFYPEAKRYTFFGPGYILLCHEETRWDPCTDDPRTREPYWYVTYAHCDEGSPAELFGRLMPYPLDYVGFSRHGKSKGRAMRFFPIQRTLKLLNNGIKTEGSEATASSSSSSTASDSSRKAADPSAQEGS